MNRMTTMENSINSFIKQQNEQIQSLSTAVGILDKRSTVYNTLDSQPNIQNRRIPSLVNDNVNYPRLTHSPKRKRVDDEQLLNSEAGEPNSAFSYANVAGIRPHTGLDRASPRPGGPNRRPAPLLYGNARSGDGNSDQPIAADVELAAYGVSKDATEDQLKNFISSKGINVIEVKKLTTYEHARTNTFKICIKASDYDKALKPEVWPLRVGFRMFRPKRTQTWAQQSASAGGNVQANSVNSQGTRVVNNTVAPPSVPVTPVSTSNRFALLGELGGSSTSNNQN